MYRELSLVLLLIGLVSSQTCPQELDAEVIIIGAGMAGVSAAKCLNELDIKNVLILEGSSRVGGRVTSAEFAGVRSSVYGNTTFTGMVMNCLTSWMKPSQTLPSQRTMATITATGLTWSRYS